MYCSKCGEKLIGADQRFCQNCGTEIPVISKTPTYKSEEIQMVNTPKVVYVPVKPQQRLVRGPPGKNSKFCFAFALVSIFIGIITLVVGYNYFRFFIGYNYNLIGAVIFSIGMLLLRILGLLLGVFSKVNGSKAEIFEPYNDLEKSGSIFAIFGIIINAIGLFLSLMGPWSIFIYPPIYY